MSNEDARTYVSGMVLINNIGILVTNQDIRNEQRGREYLLGTHPAHKPRH